MIQVSKSMARKGYSSRVRLEERDGIGWDRIGYGE
jgi:hypothetical protein